MDFSVIAAKRASKDRVALESADRQVLATSTTTGSQAPVTVSVKAGLRGDVNDKDQSIHVTKALAASWISVSADKKTVSINPQWDLDLSSQYTITIPKGAFVSDIGAHAAPRLDVNFATLKPGTATNISQAVASSKMNAEGGLDANTSPIFY